MAIKQIDVVINTSRGEKNMRQLNRVAQQVEKTFGNINKLKINIKTDPAQAALKRLNAQIQQGKQIIDNFGRGDRLNNFAGKISNIKEEMMLVRKAFEDAGRATERQRAATALLAGNFKALRLEATAFAMASGTDPSKTIGSVSARLKEIEKFPRTILAGNEAMSMLKRMQEMTIVGSEEFLRISKAIGRQLGINANIQSQAARAAKPFQSSMAFVSQEQISALGGKTLVPPSRRLPEAGQTSSQFLTPTNMQRKVARQRIESSSKVLRNEKEITKQNAKQASINRKTAFRRLENIRRIRKQRRQEQFLGAGFPLLFGGGAGAVGGSILGSALAPKGMGFGAQILGSALGTLLERNLQTITAIGNAAREINLDALEESSIGVNRELAKTVTLLKQQGETEQARRTIQNEIAMQTGMLPGSPEDIANNINLLNAEFKKFTATAAGTLGIISAPFITALTGILKIVNGILFAVNSLFTMTGFIFKELIKMLDRFPFIEKFLNNITKDIENANEIVTGTGKAFDQYIISLGKEKDIIMQRIELGDKEAAIQKKIADAVAIYGEENRKAIDEAIRALAAAEAQEVQAQKLKELYKSIGQSVEDGLVSAIQGAIDGTKTLGDVARSVFSQIQRSLIRFGVNSLLTGLFPGSSLFRANGGTVSRGKSYIVGERGAEMFVPNAGGRIVPNSDMGGSTNVVVNVDASGSNVQGDQQRGKELGAALSVAIQSELLKQKRPGGLLA
tara:strand:+ start:2185 stop:4392 length:2208 start_codon:yes stop_codon:yes gene_type:complete